MKLSFLTYIARSGSTLLLHQLEQQYDVFVFPEMGFLSGYLLKKPFETFGLSRKQFNKLKHLQSEHPQLKLWPIAQVIKNRKHNQSNFEVFIDLLTVYAKQHGAKSGNWIFKQQFIPSLVEIAKRKYYEPFHLCSIALFRDPRAILNSQIKAKGVSSREFTSNPYYLASQWKLFHQWIDATPHKLILKIQYEELLRFPNKILLEIADSFGFSKIQEKMPHTPFIERLSEKDKVLHKNVTAPIDLTRDEAWTRELPLKYAFLLDYLLKDLFLKYGYTSTKMSYNKFYLFGALLYYGVTAKLVYNRWMLTYL